MLLCTDVERASQRGFLRRRRRRPMPSMQRDLGLAAGCLGVLSNDRFDAMPWWVVTCGPASLTGASLTAVPPPNGHNGHSGPTPQPPTDCLLL